MTQERNTLVGRIPKRRGRAPKTVAEGRICAEASCDTQLTTYNKLDRCYQHQEKRFPRVRGRTPKARPKK